MGSSSLQLNNTDWAKIGKGAVVAIVGAAVAYVTTSVLPVLKDSPDSVDAVLYVAFSVLVNVARKWVSDTRD